MNRVRSDEGLAYSAGSSFPGGVYYPLTFTAGFQSKSRTVAYASSIVLQEMESFLKEPVKDEELHVSKRSFIDRFPRAFATKGMVASRFADDEFTGRFAKDPDYYKNYRQRIDSVTKEDVLRVAKKYLTPDKLVILIVGDKEEILKGHPNHSDVTLQSLVPGQKIIDVPLRDPMTMQPLPAGK
jgi:predicted Zn-dependent peptidase